MLNCVINKKGACYFKCDDGRGTFCQTLRCVMAMWHHKKKNNSIATEPKGTEYWDLTYKEFKIAVMKRYNKLPED